MSANTWELMCVDCRTEITLGKAVNRTAIGQRLPWQFAGFVDHPSRIPVEGSDLWAIVQHFLMLHKGHALGVVPWRLLEQLDEEAQHYDSPMLGSEEFLATEPADAELDVDLVSQSLMAQLREALSDNGK